MSVPAAERLYEKHQPHGWPQDLREAAGWYTAVLGVGNPERDRWEERRAAWRALSTGEQALIRIALSLWGAPGVEVALYRDLGAIDQNYQRDVLAAIATACNL